MGCLRTALFRHAAVFVSHWDEHPSRGAVVDLMGSEARSWTEGRR